MTKNKSKGLVSWKPYHRMSWFWWGGKMVRHILPLDSPLESVLCHQTSSLVPCWSLHYNAWPQDSFCSKIITSSINKCYSALSKRFLTIFKFAQQNLHNNWHTQRTWLSFPGRRKQNALGQTSACRHGKTPDLTFGHPRTASVCPDRAGWTLLQPQAPRTPWYLSWNHYHQFRITGCHGCWNLYVTISVNFALIILDHISIN